MKMSKTMVSVEGYVWCDAHGCVHEDTTNPYDCEDDLCTGDMGVEDVKRYGAPHRKLFMGQLL